MDSEGISAERKVEIRVRRNGRKDKVIVEKSAAEGLPEGWIKKLVISNRSGPKVRRDSLFIDPKSGYVFQSFKDASRYVETGYIGHYARKLKESDIEDDDSGSGNTVVPLALASVEKKSVDDLGKKEEAKDPMEKQPISKRVTRSQAKASKNEENCDLKSKNPSSSNAKSEEETVRSRLRSANSQDPEKEPVMKEEGVQESTEKRITRSKAKVKRYELSNNVARRASKRLAGIELEPTPEVKTRSKAQRVVPPDAGKCKKPVKPAATKDIHVNQEVAESYNEDSCVKAIAASDNYNREIEEMEVEIEKMGKAVGRNGCGDEKEMKTPVVAEVNPVFHLDGYKHKEEMSPVSPLSRQTCGTKYEKRVEGKGLGDSSRNAKVTSPKATKISSPLRSSKKGEYPCDNNNATIQRRNKVVSNESPKPSAVKGACSEVIEKNANTNSTAFDSTLADLWKDPCIAFAIKTLTGESPCLPETGGAISSSSDPKPGDVNRGSEKPSADIWKDPCIDFAIKTLTGAIPVGADGGFKSSTASRGSCDRLFQQCNMKKTGDVRFQQSFSSKD